MTLFATLRSALIAAAAVILPAIGCASAPPLTPQARTEVLSVGDSVDRVAAQFDRSRNALAAVRDDWDTDPDKSIRTFAIEVGALETFVKGVSEPNSDIYFARWDAQLEAVRDTELAAAAESDHDAINRAFDHTQRQIDDLRDVFAPVYTRMLTFREQFRQRSSGATVESLLTDIRRTTTESKETAARFDRLRKSLDTLAGAKPR